MFKLGRLFKQLEVYKPYGDRNKSGKNRIVPVPYYVQENLLKNKDLNIFSGTQKAYSEDYFKGLWTKFKRVSKLLKKIKLFIHLDILVL